MVSSESEEDARKIDRRRQPLCLFHDDHDDPCRDHTYMGECLKKEAGLPLRERKYAARKAKEDLWLRRRREVNMKRRRQEAGRHLKNYIFMSGRPDSEEQEEYVPRLVTALEVLKDAWPPKKRTFDERHFDEESPTPRRPEPRMPGQGKEGTRQTLLLSRRSSVPEEVIRRYCLKKSLTSEGSETNLTVPEVTPGSSKGGDAPQENDPAKMKTEAEPAKEDARARDELSVPDGRMKRVMQSEFDKHGRGIIRQKTRERSSQTGRSETTPTVEEDTEESRPSESLPSSSPVELPRQVVEGGSSTSENLSSESDEVGCTCAEISSSKDTSTDLFRSGNSTLSQTVSEKSTSTQDSTVSVHSVSTGGSTFSPGSNSTSPDTYARASAKDTSSPDFVPRTMMRTTRRFARGRSLRDRGACGMRYPKIRSKKRWKQHRGSSNGVFEDILEDKETREASEKAIDDDDDDAAFPKPEEGNGQAEEEKAAATENAADTKYPWAKCTPEEAYMIQQMNHRKFVESDRSFSVPVPATPDTGSLSTCATIGSTYKDRSELGERVLIPRYSALPRTMSMLVNTSSANTSMHNSDSELSLSDSLEEFPITHIHRLVSYDTKKESKPVRGDVTAHQDTSKRSRCKHKHRLSHAFFISIKDPYGEDDLLSGIEKIPEPPKKIMERINERQLKLFSLQRRNLEKRRAAREMLEGVSKDKKGVEHKTARKKREHRDKEGNPSRSTKDTETYRQPAGQKTLPEQSTSKAPAASAPISPDRELPCCRKKKSRKEWEARAEGKVKKNAENKTFPAEERPSVEKESPGRCKPQAVIHPSQMPPCEAEVPRRTKQSLTNTTRTMKFRQRFEVIPEEKSSSMSSTDDNRANERKAHVQARLKETSENIPPADPNSVDTRGRKHSTANTTDVVLAKFTSKSLQSVASLHKRSGKEQPIIVVENPTETNSANSRKGRDALVAMNREDFNRLSKGWMNFYVLKEHAEAPEHAERDEKRDRDKQGEKALQRASNNAEERVPQRSAREKAKMEDAKEYEEMIKEDDTADNLTGNPQRKQEDEALRFYSSNTILTPIKTAAQKEPKRLSLPELKVNTSASTNPEHPNLKSPTIFLPKVYHKNSDNDGMDSDSTVYCQPPPFIVPRLDFHGSGDFPSEDTVSSENDDPGNGSLMGQQLPLGKRNNVRRLRERREDSNPSLRAGGQGRSEWSVTVAGTLELTRAAPDLEMRLSFPADGIGPPQASQSDSGFTEDVSGQNAEASVRTDRGAFFTRNTKQRWMVTVKNPTQGGSGVAKQKPHRPHLLPDLGQSQSRNVKKVLKESSAASSRKDYRGEISFYWPRVELAQAEWADEGNNDEALSVRGSAVSLEKKSRPPTMTERDLGRIWTARLSRSKT